MDTDEIDLLLEKTPATSTLKPYRKQPGKHEQEKIDAVMWEAIDHNDENALAHALASGARVARLRNGIPPIWHCAQTNQYGLARQLMQKGADPLAIAKGASIWAAIASRDDADEAERLADLIGGTPRLDTAELARHRAWRVMVWAAKRQGFVQREWSRSKYEGMAEFMLPWVNGAVHGPEEIIELLTREWYQGPDETVEASTGSGILRASWGQVAIRDDIEKARRLLRYGWLSSKTGNDKQMPSYARSISPLWRHGMGWVFLGKGAWNLWTWWMLSDNRRKEFTSAIRCAPDQTL